MGNTADNEPTVDKNGSERGEVDELKLAIERSSTINSKLLVVFLLSMVYFLVTAATTTDLQLLVPNSRVTLPILSVQIDLYKFCIIAPLIVLVIHFNFLFSLYLHSNYLRRWTKYCKTKGPAFSPCKNPDFSPFLLNSLISADMPKNNRQFWLKLAVGIVVYLFPLLILGIIQLRYADYHDIILTTYHFSILLMDFALLCVFWQGIINMAFTRATFEWPIPTSKILDWAKFPFILSKNILNYFSENARKTGFVFLLLIVFFGSYLLTILAVIKFPSGPETYRWANTTRWYIPRLKITDNQFLSFGLNSQFVPEQLVKKMVDNVGGTLMNDLSRGINLSGRDLRLANFSKSNLLNADLSNTQLQGSNLAGTILHGANLQNTQLQWSNMTGAQFDKRSVLDETMLQEASLEGAHLNDSSLNRANINGANLTNAEMERTVLRNCKLNGAFLVGTHLNNAKLFNVELKGADLNSAKMRNAVLERVQLQGSDLSLSDLTGAIFRESNMEAVNLTNAILENASIVRTRLNWSILTNANLNHAKVLNSSLDDCLLNNTDLKEITLNEASIKGALFKSTFFETEIEGITSAHVTGARIRFTFPQDRELIVKLIQDSDFFSKLKVRVLLTLQKVQKDRLDFLILATSPSTTKGQLQEFAKTGSNMPSLYNSDSPKENEPLISIAKYLEIAPEIIEKLISGEQLSPPSDTNSRNKDMKDQEILFRIAKQVNDPGEGFEFKIFEFGKPAVEIIEEVFKKKEDFIINRNNLACENIYIAKSLFLQLLHEKGATANGERRQMIRYMDENCSDISKEIAPN